MNKIVVIEQSELINILNSIVSSKTDKIIDQVQQLTPLTNNSKYYTRNEVAELCKVSTQTIWEWRRKGIIRPPKTIGRRVLFLKSDIDDVIEKVNTNHIFPLT